MNLLLFFIVLVIALAIGWAMGRWQFLCKRRPSHSDALMLSRDYFVGLNFLLAEQPDRAIETFSQAIEVNSETIDTHITLGNLFRRRGEADRAVKIHQNLLARSALSNHQNQQVQLELARDFMHLGVLDRAEILLRQLIEEKNINKNIANSARNLLLDILQQEKEWQAALAIASQQRIRQQPRLQRAVANWLCELALIEFRQNHLEEGDQQLRRAQQLYPGSVRSHWIQAERLHQLGQYQEEIAALSRIIQLDSAFAPFVLPQLKNAYLMLNDETGLIKHLDYILTQTPCVTAQLLRTQQGLALDGLQKTTERLDQQLKTFPNLRGVALLTALDEKCIDPCLIQERQLIKRLQHHLEQLALDEVRYACCRCGFQLEQLYWHCPQCHDWETIKPINEFPNENQIR